MNATPVIDPFAWVTVADVELCLRNSAKLERDSRLVSRPRKVALLELSLEELGKGAILGLALVVRRFRPSALSPDDQLVTSGTRVYRNVLPTTTHESLKKILEPLYSESFADDVEVAFSRHKIKLEYVDRLNKLMAVVYEAFLANPEFLEISSQQYARIRGERRAKLQVEVTKRTAKRFAAYHANAVIPDTGAVAQWKNEGLYVDIRDGHCVMPIGSAEQVRSLRKTIRATRFTVSSMARLFSTAVFS